MVGAGIALATRSDIGNAFNNEGQQYLSNRTNREIDKDVSEELGILGQGDNLARFEVLYPDMAVAIAWSFASEEGGFVC